MAEKIEPITPLKRFWRLLKPDKKEITNIYVYAVFNGLVNLSLPLGIQAIINQIQGAQMSTSWIVLVIIVILGIAATGFLQIQQLKITEHLQQRIFTRAAFEFAYRIPRIKLEKLYQHFAPELINRFFDIISVQKGLSKMLIDFSVAVLQVIFGLILLSLYHPFFIAFGLVLIISVYAIFRFTVEKGLNTSLKESKYKYQVAYWLQELARTNSTFKLAGKTDLPLERVESHTKSYLGARENHFKVLVQQYSLMVIFKVVVAAGLLIIGSILVMDQQMNIGQFVAAEIIILLIIGSVEKLIIAIETIYDVLTSLEKIAQVTDLDLENHDGVDLVRECGECGLSVSLQNLTFNYPNKSKPTLKDVSLEIESDERIMLMGTNGSGKSTLLQLLAGLYEIEEGSISYNEIPKSNLKLESLRSVIGDSLSQEQVFQGTLMENITMGRPEANFDNVKWAVNKLGLDTYVKSLPLGYNTQLSPDSKKIPRSTIQKILLARSIADKPKLVLLEDAFEHLDTIDRRKIIDFLMDKKNRWTLVSVSADSYLASKCDRVLVMDDGSIKMSGNYSELKEIINFKPLDNA
tara:strand:- start:184 stop:1914 length:1731 start_codon:yes stop_codon:yes gene_type:complete